MVQAAKNIDLPVSKPVLSIDMIIDMQPKVFFLFHRCNVRVFLLEGGMGLNKE